MAGVKVKWDERRGVWVARLFIGRTDDGKKVERQHDLPDAKTEGQAIKLAEAWEASQYANGLLGGALLYNLLNEFIDMRSLKGYSPNSVRAYRRFAKYVSKYLPGVNARDVSSFDLSRFEQRLLTPKDKGGQGLSQNSVRGVHDFLNATFTFFVKMKVCDSNPLLSVDKPKLVHHDAQALNIGDFRTIEAQLKALLKPSIINRKTYRKAMNAFAAWMALETGMRVGEVCAVRNCDYSKDAQKNKNPQIIVGGTVQEETGKKPYRRNETKGRVSRPITLNKSDIETIDGYIQLRTSFCGELPPDAPLITFDGGYCRPTTISKAFKRIAEQSGMPKGFTFHDLRHTHATWLLMSGVAVQEVSQRLGHGDAATTLRIYAHVLPGSDARAAAVFEEAVNDVMASGESVSG
ncbi:site-specific integrase [Olsenella sp. Marseille-P4559]|uniref:tyrosine-type recombinase/integrase n=1 Tax=Olsenella sp. Marseille-P4559 TaxID=2364795 RepID=UPI0013EF3692|nr:site-specific integrase [Olsenella sp. Marseille-P4559]